LLDLRTSTGSHRTGQPARPQLRIAKIARSELQISNRPTVGRRPAESSDADVARENWNTLETDQIEGSPTGETSSLSMRRPSRSITSKRQPLASKLSPSSGMRFNSAIT
jgi:hypothetical protein